MSTSSSITPSSTATINNNDNKPTSASEITDTVLSFWFDGLPKHPDSQCNLTTEQRQQITQRWWRSTPEFDHQCADIGFHVLPLLSSNTSLKQEMQSTDDGLLALIILYDQLCRNAFRGKADAFNYEQDAIQCSLTLIEQHRDVNFGNDYRMFIYLPLMHSEQLELHDLCVKKFEECQPDAVKFATDHRDVIQRFKRYPHRNRLLGRKHTIEEIRYLLSPDAPGWATSAIDRDHLQRELHELQQTEHKSEL